MSRHAACYALRMRVFARLVLLGVAVCLAPALARADEPQPQPPILVPDAHAEWRVTAKRRTTTTLSLALAGEAASMAFLAWAAFSGRGARLRDALAARINRRVLLNITFIVTLCILMFAVTVPFEFARYAVLRSYGIAQQTPWPWFAERLLELSVNIASALFLGLLFYAVVVRRPRTWWRWVAGAALPLTAAAILASPFYVQLFNTLSPITNRALADRILALAGRYDIPASEVYEIDMSRQTRSANAFVTGIGPTTTIALGDTLLTTFRDDETLFVTAHEMGHYVHKHLWIGLGLGTLSVVLASWILQKALDRIVARSGKRLGYHELGDIASLPLVLLAVSVLSFASLPISNSISRAMEADADRFAMRLTVPGDVSREAAASAFERLGQIALSDPDPNPVLRFVFWSHPTLDERISMALNN